MATKRIRLPGPPPTEGSGSTPLTIEFLVEQPFLATREHARFVEFAEACAHYRYIGVCHGRPGVGKTRSAREFSSFPDLGAPQGLSYGQRQSEQMVNKSLSVAAKYIKFRGFVRLDELEVTGSPLVMFHPRSS